MRVRDEKSDDVRIFPGSQVHTAIVEKIVLFLELKRKHTVVVFLTHLPRKPVEVRRRQDIDCACPQRILLVVFHFLVVESSCCNKR